MSRSSANKAARYCGCCNDRFIPGGIANHGICIACTRIAQDIIRVCGPEWVSMKSVLFARNRERLQPLIQARTRENSAAFFGGATNIRSEF
jgi:hypothetical protein